MAKIYDFTPEDLGMERYAIEDIRGGISGRNAEILLNVLQNPDQVHS